MNEIEVKIIEVDRAKIERILLSLGAKKIFDGNIETCFFDFKDGSITKARNLVRLRKEGENNILTFKEFKAEKTVKIMEECEVLVSDFRNMKKILESIGLSMFEHLEKHRSSYILDGVHFECDKYKADYEHIPEFLEIEAEDQKTIYRYAKKLGFEAEDCRPWSTQDLIEHYSRIRDRDSEAGKHLS